MNLLQSIQNTVKQRPQSVASLFKRHRFGAEVNNRNVANGIIISPAFYKDLVSLVGGGNYSNATGDAERFTLAEKLANASLVFANTLQASQRRPEHFNQNLPGAFEPTGKYAVIPYGRTGLAFDQDYPSSRIFGIDRKIAIGLGIALVIFLLYELNKK